MTEGRMEEAREELGALAAYPWTWGDTDRRMEDLCGVWEAALTVYEAAIRESYRPLLEAARGLQAAAEAVDDAPNGTYTGGGTCVVPLALMDGLDQAIEALRAALEPFDTEDRGQ